MTGERSGQAPLAPGSIDAVIFDLDGVIVDSEIWWDEARHAFAVAHGRTWTVDDRHAVMGANSRQWSETMRQRLDLELSAAEIERAVVDAMVERYSREGAPVIPGAVDAVRRVAATHPAGLASSSHPAVIDAALHATGLVGTFRAIVSSDEVSHGKPQPDVFLEAARRLGAGPGRTVVVEDSLNGVRAGKAAGMTVVLVRNRSVPPAPGATDLADVVLSDLAALDLDGLASTTNPPSDSDGRPQDEPAPGAAAGVEQARSGSAARGGARSRSTVPDTIHPVRRTLRVWISRVVAWIVCRAVLRPVLTGRERIPRGPAVYCLNHLSWLDPFVVMATLPMRPRLMFFGPKEEDMSVGGRNRLMSWTGTTIPYRPGKNDLLEATRRVHTAIAGGSAVVIFGEGRIRPVESMIGPLSEGAAYFALREGVPLVPIAIRGTSWVGFGRRVEVRVGEPIASRSRATREAVDALTEDVARSLEEMVADAPVPTLPGRFGRWLSELFNDWPEGNRAAAERAVRDSHPAAAREAIEPA